eukprot:3770827-Pleurochrysis_carterae.AAC.2
MQRSLLCACVCASASAPEPERDGANVEPGPILGEATALGLQRLEQIATRRQLKHEVEVIAVLHMKDEILRQARIEVQSRCIQRRSLVRGCCNNGDRVNGERGF